MSNWFHESNRPKHFFYGAILGFIGTILMAIGAAIGMEFKDYQYNCDKKSFDWLDILATVLGGFVGNAITALIVILCIYG